MKTRQLSIRIPTDLYTMLETEARHRKCVISKVINERLAEQPPVDKDMIAKLNDRLTAMEQLIKGDLS